MLNSMVEYYLNLSIPLFLKIFKMWAISKAFTEFVTMLLLFYFGILALRPKWGILTPLPGIEPAHPTFEQGMNLYPLH